MPWDKQKRFVKEYEISENNTRVLIKTKQLAEFFESAVEHGRKHGVEAGKIANLIVNRKVDIESVLPTNIIEEILGKRVGSITDEGQLKKLAKESIEENLDMVTSYKRGKTTVIQALIGAVMRKSSGKADVSLVKRLLEDLLGR